MKWPTYEAFDGDVRRRVVFAWWPTRCSDDVTRWLERVEHVEQYWRDAFGYKAEWVTVAYHAAGSPSEDPRP